MKTGCFPMDALPKLLALAEKADALLIGCGLGHSDTLTEIVCTLLEKAACQIVLDADGINSITGHKDILRRTAKPVVLTPHAGEFARLRGKPDATAADAAQFAQDYRCIVLYKGHRTAFLRRTARRIAIPRAIPAWRKVAAGMFWRHAGFAVRTGH